MTHHVASHERQSGRDRRRQIRCLSTRTDKHRFVDVHPRNVTATHCNRDSKPPGSGSELQNAGPTFLRQASVGVDVVIIGLVPLIVVPPIVVDVVNAIAERGAGSITEVDLFGILR